MILSDYRLAELRDLHYQLDHPQVVAAIDEVRDLRKLLAPAIAAAKEATPGDTWIASGDDVTTWPPMIWPVATCKMLAADAEFIVAARNAIAQVAELYGEGGR